MATPPDAPRPPPSQSEAQAAQVPLQNFVLPAFPPEADSLRSLTLTCDIKLPDYQALVSATPNALAPGLGLPPSITDLTLELFSLGFPDNFLTNLASALPNLRNLTIFSCLIDGLNEGSRRDAEAFFRTTISGEKDGDNRAGQRRAGLRELHLLDTFARPGFWRKIAVAAAGGAEGRGEEAGALQFLEVSYTDRSTDDATFTSRILANELISFAAVPSLVALSLTLSAPAPPAPPPLPGDPTTTTLPSNGSGRPAEGIRPIPQIEAAAERLLTSQLQYLKMLDLTLYTLNMRQVEEVVSASRGVAVLSVSISMDEEDSGDGDGRNDSEEGGKYGSFHRRLSEALNHGVQAIEVLEVVAVPGEGVWKKVSPLCCEAATQCPFSCEMPAWTLWFSALCSFDPTRR